MDDFILTCFHHEGNVVDDHKPTYKNELDVFVVDIDKDHFSLVEFLSCTNDLGYTKVKGFYYQHIDGGDLVQITSDRQLLDFTFFKDGIGNDVNEDRRLNLDLDRNEIDLHSEESSGGKIPDEDGSDIDE
ncbi:hypothetical protein FXO37_20132 [Capsicum annuum]|nr:hypothetical protein FXO37_20132 [Capsicum annuum]